VYVASQRPSPDPSGKALAGSLLTHGLVIAAVATSGLWKLNNSTWGDVHASSGSVGVTMVSTIPIPRNEGKTNPLANPTKSIIPEAPAPVKMQKQVEAPVKDAIPVPSRLEKAKKVSPQKESKLVFRPPEEYKPNQVYSNTAQALSSPLYGTKGTGGIDIGPASELGSKFGGYVDLMRDRIAQHWVTADVKALPSQKCTMSFTIARNGTVSNVQISTPSGNYLLDTSAKRAVLDASPLPPLPNEFTKTDATVELGFQLRQ